MKLHTITCSGANEHTDIPAMFNFLYCSPRVEIGVQVSGKEASVGMSRYKWIGELVERATLRRMPMQAALHVNKDWVVEFCNGSVPTELAEFMEIRDHKSEPFFKRIQLNFKVDRETTVNDPLLVAEMIGRYPAHQFILSYNEANASFINDVHELGVYFDVLYDGSFGTGVLPDKRPAPVFKDHFQGYAGGMTPENVAGELEKITRVVPHGRPIYIDAERGIAEEKHHLSLGKARFLARNAKNWAVANNAWAFER